MSRETGTLDQSAQSFDVPTVVGELQTVIGAARAAVVAAIEAGGSSSPSLEARNQSGYLLSGADWLLRLAAAGLRQSRALGKIHAPPQDWPRTCGAFSFCWPWKCPAPPDQGGAPCGSFGCVNRELVRPQSAGPAGDDAADVGEPNPRLVLADSRLCIAP